MLVRIQQKPQTKEDKRRARAMRKVWCDVRPGAIVRCITDLSDWGWFAKINVPIQGEVYTVRELRRGIWRAWALGFTVVEVSNEVSKNLGSEAFFGANDFEIVSGALESEKVGLQLRLIQGGLSASRSG